MNWTTDPDGDLILEGTHDATICPHHEGTVKAAWDFGRWYSYFDTIDHAKSFIEQWWTDHPQGLSTEAHRTVVALDWRMWKDCLEDAK